MSAEEFYRAVYESGTSLRMEIEFDVTGKFFNVIAPFWFVHLLLRTRKCISMKESNRVVMD